MASMARSNSTLSGCLESTLAIGFCTFLLFFFFLLLLASGLVVVFWVTVVVAAPGAWFGAELGAGGVPVLWG